MNKSKQKTALTFIVLLVLFSSTVFAQLANTFESTFTLDNWKTERDYICTLAAFSVVYKDWQTDNERGYNIGSVLLSDTTEAGRLVFWARNCNNVTENQSQHGEVRLMLGYLAKLHRKRKQGKSVPDIKNLKGHIVYTTLEPCAQCSGMMVLLNVYRTVYGQTDPGFGKAIERLKLDSSNLPHGYKPYPRPVISEKTDIVYFKKLEEAYDEYRQTHTEPSITDFLKTEPARDFFWSAYFAFLSWDAMFIKNRDFLQHAKTFVESVPSDFTPLKPDI
jgi:tRNA(Arg) A34 adenosine deaminase TadA